MREKKKERSAINERDETVCKHKEGWERLTSFPSAALSE